MDGGKSGYLQICHSIASAKASCATANAGFAAHPGAQVVFFCGKGCRYLSRLNVGEEMPHFVFQAFRFYRKRIRQRLDVCRGRARPYRSAGDAAD